MDGDGALQPECELKTASSSTTTPARSPHGGGPKRDGGGNGQSGLGRGVSSTTEEEEEGEEDDDDDVMEEGLEEEEEEEEMKEEAEEEMRVGEDVVNPEVEEEEGEKRVEEEEEEEEKEEVKEEGIDEGGANGNNHPGLEEVTDDDNDDGDVNINIDGGVDDDDDKDDDDEGEGGDTTDGGPPPSEKNSLLEQVLVKRPHIQSKRMQEYHAMQQMTHTPGRVFLCPTCQREFNSGPGLKYHIRMHQTSLKNFSCDSCHKEFKSMNGLKYHQRGGKRCQGHTKGSNAKTNKAVDGQASLSHASDCSKATPPLLVLSPREDCPAPRLLDLANIATGPQSPLLQGLDTSSASTSFFDSPEKNAVMALSCMAQKRSSRRSLTEELPEEHNVKCGEEESGMKSKRPMNGFMLFAQKNRADFNKMYPQTNNRMISTKLSEEWSKLPEAERQRWKEDARQMAEVQRSKHPDCWKRKKYTKDRH